MGAGCGKSSHRNVYNPQLLVAKIKKPSDHQSSQKTLVNPDYFFKPAKPKIESRGVRFVKINRELIADTCNALHSQHESSKTNNYIEPREAERMVKRKSTTNLEDIQLFSFRMPTPKHSDQQLATSKDCSPASSEASLARRQVTPTRADQAVLKHVVHKNVLRQHDPLAPCVCGNPPLTPIEDDMSLNDEVVWNASLISGSKLEGKA